jgi:hypothetical protein
MTSILSKPIKNEEDFLFEFSICTLVTKIAEYQEMLESYRLAGFNNQNSEFLYIDNSEENNFEAYAGLNRFLREAKGKYVILCHQDVLINFHNIDDLRKRIIEIETLDSKWALLGNSGGINVKFAPIHLVEGNGNNLHEELLPLKTETFDENFIIVKSKANLALSNDLNGFHFYGTDICLIADILGFNSYIIDFKITHKGVGNADGEFDRLQVDIIKKYNRAFRSRFIATTAFSRFFISGNKVLTLFSNNWLVLYLAKKYFKLFWPKNKYQLLGLMDKK